MLSCIVCFVVALLASVSAAEVVRVAAFLRGVVDHPGGRRLHERPTPRLGGLAIFWGFGLAVAFGIHGVAPSAAFGDEHGIRLVGLCRGGGALLLVGLMDDIYAFGPLPKLAAQIAVAIGLHHFGWSVEILSVPGIGTWTMGQWSLPLTVAWVVLVTNALNLIDGLDGLAVGLALVATGGSALVLARAGDPMVLPAVALVGALLGFLWYNFHPALIFMGDAGSLLLGVVVAALTLRAGQVISPSDFPILPALLLAVPLFDTLFAIVRRISDAARATRSIAGFLRAAPRRALAPDGRHVHHRLVRRGLTTRRAVLLLWTLALGFAMAGLAWTVSPWAGILLVLPGVWSLARVVRRLRARNAFEPGREPA
jgi:UDP-GlcNAc:undecaprenyl-phosphate GlcNAc-1-phosphate transferase